jgi:macrolide transport system ATP-binding/permease protein
MSSTSCRPTSADVGPMTDLGSMGTPGVLRVRDVSRRFGDRVVLDGIDLLAAPGRRIGLIGENGSGKSTLLRILAGVDEPDTGTVRRPTDLAYLPQEPSFVGAEPGPHVSIGDVLDAALAPLHRLVALVEERGAAMAARPADRSLARAYGETLETAQRREAWDADRRATVAADRLGLAALHRERPVTDLSGGQRSRLALAALIAGRPDCVLMDEPTNHLDDDALDLLEEFLVGLPGVVVVASHDRVLLDRVCTDLFDLDPPGPGTDGTGGRRFGGGYRRYLADREATHRRWVRTYVEQQETIERLRRDAEVDTTRVAHGRGPRDNDKFIHAFKGANVERAAARRARDAARRLADAERTALPRPPTPLRFTGHLGSPRPAPDETAILVEDLAVEGRLRLPHLRVPGGQRLLVLGGNGTGKSTLLRVLAGQLRPTSGQVRVTAQSVGLLGQHVAFPEPDQPARRVFAAALVDRAADVDEAGTLLLDLGLLRATDLDQPVGRLSVGQQRRLALAVLVARSPELVRLDEPTNHLSLALADELEQAVGTAPATVVLASHDRWLRTRWSGPTHELVPQGPTTARW